MNDEIKEILDKLEKVANRETASRNALMEMKDTDYRDLLDYITNLQEEIQKKEAMYDSLAVSYRLEQEENERLNNIIKKLENYLLDMGMPRDYLKELEW